MGDRWRQRGAPMGLVAAVAVATAAGCSESAPPPGRAMDAPELAAEPPTLALPAPAPTASAAVETDDPAELVPGRGDKLAAVAMRTWVYLLPDSDSTKLGYLRAGTVVERSRKPHGHKRCDGGWYRIAPRGFVCADKGATTDLEHPIVKLMPRGARRGEPMPYLYAISRKPPPHLYFKLPTLEQQDDAEGKRRVQSMLLFADDQRQRLGALDEVPPLLRDGAELPKPYGAERALHYRVHRGRANDESAFGLVAAFEHTERVFGLTSELDLLPLDRTRLAPLSDMQGVVVEDEGVPAFVIHHGVFGHELDERGSLTRKEAAPYRSGWVLNGTEKGGLMQTTKGLWLPKASLRIAKLRDDPAGFSEEGRKWIDVSIRQQLLVAYQGKKPVFATLVSTGRGEMGDPEETHATVRGTFMIHAKHVSGTMDGDEETKEPFDLRDVPYIQYFHKGYALHGAYWHDEFGKVRSHGCVNLAPRDAAWLFEWTDPEVPKAWHGALNPNAGTLIYIHG